MPAAGFQPARRASPGFFPRAKLALRDAQIGGGLGGRRRPRACPTTFYVFFGGGTGPRRIIFTARSPSSPCTHLTVTLAFSFSLPPSTTVSGVTAKVRTVDSFPKTVRVTVIRVSLKAVIVPAKN